MPTKKILLMIHNMNLGGTEKALLAFINVLKNKNVTVTVLLLEKNGTLLNQIPSWVQVDVVKDFIIIKPIIFDPPLFQIKKSIMNGKWCTAISKSWLYLKVKLTGAWFYNYEYVLKKQPISHEVDIAIAYAGPSDFITYYIHKCVRATKKYQWIHFDVSKVIFKTNFGNKYYPFFDKIYCVSDNAKLVFDNMFPRFTDKTEVFKNIISNEQLNKMAAIGETFNDDFKGIRIVTLGRISEEKGQQMIPHVVKKLKKDTLKFKWYLIGDGKMKHAIEKEIKKLNIENELILLGPKINPYCYLKDCDLYVQTSFHEGYCLTVHEAKIFNKPVVVTNVASATNLIANNEDGLIVEISEDGIYHGVKELIVNEKLRKTFSRNLLSLETINEINKIRL